MLAFRRATHESTRFAFRFADFYDHAMPTKKRNYSKSSFSEHTSAASGSPAAPVALLQQRSLELPSEGPLPKVRLRSVRMHTHLFRKLIGNVDPAARAGDLVAVETPQGELLGHGLYNP